MRHAAFGPGPLRAHRIGHARSVRVLGPDRTIRAHHPTRPGNAAAANRDGRPATYSPRRRRPHAPSSLPRNDGSSMVIPARGAPGSRCDLDSMSGHHPMRMSPERERAAVRRMGVSPAHASAGGGESRRSGAAEAHRVLPPCDQHRAGRMSRTVRYGRRRCRGRSVPRRRGRPWRQPGAAGFPAESCSRCPWARSPRLGRGCQHAAGHRRPRADHADRSTADHSVRGEAGTDEEEPAGTARPGLRRQPARRLWF